ncbi:ABC transporter ATP-binding protein [Alkalihalophilus marmarensis]|jgi:ABC-type dipeptide/oligopeptide/nickel transport system ATPase component|uniref:ABC transporter domain-containing protein n=1 Tax=Alkalihalophilus marmarensis DSM 21297 TaxID=1188261 RepID=U6SI96_9BACI|nr:ABC transporter ATP-binding protein [Alkalihalophilus marmarensis]ERN51429.1 hypothetical protein A33I_01775 [Alkalihalophilus marmarensis DSM 21297]MCM3490358.1 ABC transporter ATP-binding protein [Alkalihalophilus marmarensis]
MSLLRVEHLEISISQPSGFQPLIQDVSFQINKGEMVALVGQSGCGKSLTAQAIVGLLEKSLAITSGNILYKGENIVNYDKVRFMRLRRQEISLLIQESLNGLNPIRPIKKQMEEMIKQNRKCSKTERSSQIKFLLEEVGFSKPDQILRAYPFELSGGMRQRVMLAMILSLKPTVLILDEPTTALDVVNRNRVMRLFKHLQRALSMTILLISHDQNNIMTYSDRIITFEGKRGMYDFTRVASNYKKV